MAAAVEFDGVWKKFRRGERHDSLRDLIPGLGRRLLGRARPEGLEDSEFWVLEDVAFRVEPGQALGIIGPNGAGKSTTLKLLTKILRPTRGTSLVRGRVGALIEVAAGFHPDLTGRENVFLQGAIMGMRRADIHRRFDEIVDFSGVAAFIDTPVKRYSSGMNARLGFSIATHLNPDVLIIDEVLSVGDMTFQSRCVQRMREFKRQGVSIVFVSHNLQAVADLCDRALHLERTVRALGATTEVLDHYVRSTNTTTAPGEGAAQAIRGVQLLDQRGRPVTHVSPGDDLTLRVEYAVDAAAPDRLTFGILLHRSTDGLVVYDGNFTADECGFAQAVDGRHVVDFKLRANVTRGLYHFDCHVWDNVEQACLARVTPAATLVVNEQRTWAGVADLHIRPTFDSRARLLVVS